MTVRHNHPLLSDTGWITAGFTAQSGWSTTTAKYRRIGDWVHLHVIMSRTGATLTGGASGNITDTDVLQIPALATPTANVWCQYDTAGTSFGGARVNSSGMVQALTLHATATIASTNTFNMTAFYMIGA